MKTGTVYLLQGRGEATDGALGRLIAGLGIPVRGRAVTSGFQDLWFREQLALVEADLRSGLHSPETALVGHSYGAYVLLHVLAALPAFLGRVLLISPVLGPALAADGHCGSLPPRAGRLLDLARRGQFPSPAHLEIHSGTQDTGCDPCLAQELASCVSNALLRIVPDAGHRLPEAYLEWVLRRFLGQDGEEGSAGGPDGDTIQNPSC